MRKNQTLIIAVALLLCSAVAVQAQGIYEVIGIGANAREGGGAETAGDVVMFLSAGTSGTGVVMVRYSSPLAKGTTPMLERGGATANENGVSVDLDDDKYTVTLNLDTHGGSGDIYTLSNVRLDLREAAAPITATVSGDSNAIISGNVDVITSIEEALTVESATGSILTRGGTGMATVTIAEAFRSAFTADADITLRVTGVPENALLTVRHVVPEDEATNVMDADIAGDVTLSAAGETAMIITDGDVVGMAMVPITGDGDDIDIKIDFTDPQSDAADSLELMLTLAATSDQMDLALPIAGGMVRVMATMAPDEEPEPAGDSYFTENFIPTGGAVAFTFDAATCTLLYPYVTYNAPIMVDTGHSRHQSHGLRWR